MGTYALVFLAQCQRLIKILWKTMEELGIGQGAWLGQNVGAAPERLYPNLDCYNGATIISDPCNLSCSVESTTYDRLSTE
jgi:hypothetical protein